jgi:hypothetical protein
MAYRTPVVVAALGLFAAFSIDTAVATAAPLPHGRLDDDHPQAGSSSTGTGKSFGRPEVVVTQQEAPMLQHDQLERKARLAPARFARKPR